jgi:hypothetical protein
MKQYLYTAFILFLCINSALAQTSERNIAAADSVEKPKTSLNLATIYANDVNYYGQSSTERLPYVLANASLNFPSGFFVSAGAYKLINYGSGVSGVDLSAGYDFNITKNLTSSLSFSRSFFPDSSLFLQSANLNVLSGSLNYDWKWFTTGLNADYTPGDQSALFMTFNAAKSFDLGSLGKKDYISFDPSFELVGGTQQITTSEEVPRSGGGNQGGGGQGGLIGGLTENVRPLPKKRNNQPTEYRYITSTSFDLLSYNVRLPISYNRGSYAVEATYQGSVLSNRVVDGSKGLRSFLYLGFYYSF